MRKMVLAALAATMLCSAANAVNTLAFSFASPTQSITTAGGTLSFTGTVTAATTNVGSIYINGDGFSVSNPLRVDDTPFFDGFPLSLMPGESFTGLALTVIVPTASLAGAYGGSFYIVGGDSDTANRNFGNVDFTANVATAAVPEPASWAMMVAGFGLVGAAMRRGKVTVRYA